MIDERRQRREPDRPEDALLEPVVQLEDAVRQRQPGEQPPAEVAHRQQADREDDDDDDADREHDLDLGRAGRSGSSRSRRREAEHDDREQVEDPLDEHGPERPGQRDRAVDLQQVRAVDVAELGRARGSSRATTMKMISVAVADPEPDSRCRGRGSPSAAAEREAEVEDDERREQQQPGSRRAISAGSSSSWNPGRRRRSRTSRKIGRTSEMIVRGWRSRRPSDSASGSIAVALAPLLAATRRSTPERRSVSGVWAR